MKIKKVLSKLLCTVACLCTAVLPMGMLTACNNDRPTDNVVQDVKFDEYGKPIFTDEDGKGITLNVLSVIGAPDNTYLNIVNKAFNDTNKANGLVANISSVDTFLFYSSIANTINTDPKNAPDVIILHSERLTYMVDQNILVPFDDVYQQLGENNTFSADNYLDNVISECYAKGRNDTKTQLYGVPLDVHSGVWFVRKDIVEKNGLTMPTNKAEFESVCAALMAKKEDGTLLVRDLTTIKSQIDALPNKFDTEAIEKIRNDAWHTVDSKTDFFPVEMSASDNIESGWIPQTAILQNGGKLANADGTPAWKDSTGLEHTLEMIHEWDGKYIGANRSAETMWLNFGTGNAIFALEGPWFMESKLNEYETYLGEGSMGLLSLSGLYADDATSANANLIYGVGHAICITKTKANESMTRRLAAALYAQYITENSAKYTAGGHLPASKKVLNSDEYKNSTAYNRYLKYMGKPEDYVMLGNTKYFSEVYEQLKMAYIFTLNKNKTGTVKDFIKECYDTAMKKIQAAEAL